MRKAIGWVVLSLVVAVVLSIYYYARQVPPLTPPIAQAPAPQPPAEPEIRYPIPQETEAPLPALDASDAAAREALAALWGLEAIERFFNVDGFIRRVVATVDNLTREKLAQRLMPVKPVGGAFRTAGKGENLTFAADNAARYARYVNLATSVDTSNLVAVYFNFYPLFQRAYEDLGYPNRYFNDRLVEVIDHLLATPDLPPEAKLVQPKVLYQFADPELEARSAGQKMLLRMGNDNAARVKTKLREIRGALTRKVPGDRLSTR